MEQKMNKLARFLEVARAEIGVKETPGVESTPRIDEYLAATRGHASGDETPWCSAFTNWVVQHSGDQGTGSKAARSWLSWGLESLPVPGCIVVLWRGSVDSWRGHVGFLDHVDERGNVVLLGGNQGNRVSLRTYPRSRVLGFRVPR